MKRVLVTGGAGFIGSTLIGHLLNTHDDLEITVLDNYFTGSHDNRYLSDNITYVHGDTWDAKHILDGMEFDTVFHFGEYSRIVRSFDDVEYVMKTNLHGTTTILELCRQWGAKLIYSASSSKFGNDGKDENLSPYSWAKAKMVELIKNYHDWYGLQYEICYFFNVYGPKQITKGNYSTVIGIFERQMREGKPITVVSPGTQSRDFTDVRDVVKGVEKTVHMNMNREWMLRSGVNHKLIDVAHMFSDNVELIPERKGERFTSEEFYNDTEEVLGWKPEHTLEEWIKNLKNDKRSILN